MGSGVSWLAFSGWGDAWASNSDGQQAIILNSGAGGDWKDFVLEKTHRELRAEVRTQERQLKKVEKKIANAYKRVVVEKSEGILANLHRLETKRTEIIARIQELNIEFDPPDFDEDDIEVLLVS